jgi:hypothetical protein
MRRMHARVRRSKFERWQESTIRQTCASRPGDQLIVVIKAATSYLCGMRDHRHIPLYNSSPMVFYILHSLPEETKITVDIFRCQEHETICLFSFLKTKCTTAIS